MITYHKGDILKSNADFIIHQTNCLGKMGAGLAFKIAKFCPSHYSDYVHLCDNHKDNPKELLGKYLITYNNMGIVMEGTKNNIVALFGQLGYGRDKQYTDYAALEKAFGSFINNLEKSKKEYNYTEIETVAIPYKLGCGLGGGDWSVVENIIKKYDSPLIDIQIWELEDIVSCQTT